MTTTESPLPNTMQNDKKLDQILSEISSLKSMISDVCKSSSEKMVNHAPKTVKPVPKQNLPPNLFDQMKNHKFFKKQKEQNKPDGVAGGKQTRKRTSSKKKTRKNKKSKKSTVEKEDPPTEE